MFMLTQNLSSFSCRYSCTAVLPDSMRTDERMSPIKCAVLIFTHQSVPPGFRPPGQQRGGEVWCSGSGGWHEVQFFVFVMAQSVLRVCCPKTLNIGPDWEFWEYWEYGSKVVVSSPADAQFLRLERGAPFREERNSLKFVLFTL